MLLTSHFHARATGLFLVSYRCISGTLRVQFGNNLEPDMQYQYVNSRAKFTTHSRVMFTSDDRVDVYHINANDQDLAFNKASFRRDSWR